MLNNWPIFVFAWSAPNATEFAISNGNHLRHLLIFNKFGRLMTLYSTDMISKESLLLLLCSKTHRFHLNELLSKTNEPNRMTSEVFCFYSSSYSTEKCQNSRAICFELLFFVCLFERNEPIDAASYNEQLDRTNQRIEE